MSARRPVSLLALVSTVRSGQPPEHTACTGYGQDLEGWTAIPHVLVRTISLSLA